MNDPPEALSAQNEAELKTWPDMDPAQQALMARVWEEQPQAGSDVA